jgi:hypothetical protein
MTQMQILPGDLHWIVQVVHLGFGLAAIVFAEALGRRGETLQRVGDRGGIDQHVEVAGFERLDRPAAAGGLVAASRYGALKHK